MYPSRPWLYAAAIGALTILSVHNWSGGQQPAAEKAKSPADPNHFEFEIVQSFDAKYEGDTPGHMGRSGGLENRRPQVALGDGVYRGNEKIGVITGLGWSRVHGSLEIEFDPIAKARICVGDVVWLALDGQTAAAGR